MCLKACIEKRTREKKTKLNNDIDFSKQISQLKSGICEFSSLICRNDTQRNTHSSELLRKRAFTHSDSFHPSFTLHIMPTVFTNQKRAILFTRWPVRRAVRRVSMPVIIHQVKSRFFAIQQFPAGIETTVSNHSQPHVVIRSYLFLNESILFHRVYHEEFRFNLATSCHSFCKRPFPVQIKLVAEAFKLLPAIRAVVWKFGKEA